MAIISRGELRALLTADGEPAVSIYMPTHRTGDILQDPIRLKNLLRVAEERIVNSGVRPPEAVRLLAPAQNLLPDTYFWQHQSDGLALFIAPGVFHSYRVPQAFPELLVIGRRFHVKPLLPLFSTDGLFYVLALSQKRVVLLQCTRDSMRQITPESVPESLAEALRYDQPEKQTQIHEVGSAIPALGGKPAATFHGAGVSADYEKTNILRFFQMIDRGLHEVLREENAPLVLAAVEYLHPIYRQANTYQHLIREGIEGSPQDAKLEVLHQEAWRLAEPYIMRDINEALTQYQGASGTGRAVSDVEQVVLASWDKRVSVLFVAADTQQWGMFDQEKRAARLLEKQEPGSEDLLDFSAAHTLINGGAVYTLEPEKVPDRNPAAALLRY